MRVWREDFEYSILAPVVFKDALILEKIFIGSAVAQFIKLRKWYVRAVILLGIKGYLLFSSHH